jgi:hypothetical protein
MASKRITVYKAGGPPPSASDAEIVLPGRGLQYEGKISYLSTQGCLIDTKCRLEPGTVVEVWMRTEGMPLRVLANLVQRREQGVEFQFQTLTNQKLDQIEVLCGELVDEAARNVRREA